MPYSIYGFIFSSRALVGRRIQKKWHYDVIHSACIVYIVPLFAKPLYSKGL